MIATIEDRPALGIKDFKGRADPDWCPGCGDFGVLHALKQAIAELGLYPNEVLTVSGIGCSSNLPGYINTYGMHTLHGRALAVATGAQLANHRLDRKSTRLNSSHTVISYAVFCLKKKTKI